MTFMVRRHVLTSPRLSKCKMVVKYTAMKTLHTEASTLKFATAVIYGRKFFMRSIPGVGSWQFPEGWWTWLEKRQPEQKTRIRSQILVGPTKLSLDSKGLVQYSQHFIFFLTCHTNGHIVEQLTKYQWAARMPALQCFILDLEKRY
jgi:hypothetical protein